MNVWDPIALILILLLIVIVFDFISYFRVKTKLYKPIFQALAKLPATRLSRRNPYFYDIEIEKLYAAYNCFDPDKFKICKMYIVSRRSESQFTQWLVSLLYIAVFLLAAFSIGYIAGSAVSWNSLLNENAESGALALASLIAAVNHLNLSSLKKKMYKKHAAVIDQIAAERKIESV